MGNAWLKRKTPEEQLAFHRARYQKRREYTEKWKAEKAHIWHANCHQNAVKAKHPEAYAKRDIQTKDLAEWLLRMRGCPCRYCGEPAYTIDHIIPLAWWGTHTWDNIHMVCSYCNGAKRDYKESEFIRKSIQIADYTCPIIINL